MLVSSVNLLKEFISESRFLLGVFTRGERPLGVTLLAILSIIVVVLFFVVATMWMYLGSFTIIGFEFAAVTVLIYMFGGIINLALAYGLWNGKYWAWVLLLFFLIMAIFGGLISFVSYIFVFAASSSTILISIIDVILSVLIIYYITRPHVKAFFGKSKKAAFEFNL